MVTWEQAATTSSFKPRWKGAAQQHWRCQGRAARTARGRHALPSHGSILLAPCNRLGRRRRRHHLGIRGTSCEASTPAGTGRATAPRKAAAIFRAMGGRTAVFRATGGRTGGHRATRRQPGQGLLVCASFRQHLLSLKRAVVSFCSLPSILVSFALFPILLRLPESDSDSVALGCSAHAASRHKNATVGAEDLSAVKPMPAMSRSHGEPAVRREMSFFPHTSVVKSRDNLVKSRHF
jgi:hypothetical protein